ncbi:GAF domain-containing protein [Leptolyngbya sp. AN02str]|uniref:sensor histidine kinase n=1 Tax=Leptolyngbya sp. AN02str TaxID=3423363 RepID=UPI003D31547B
MSPLRLLFVEDSLLDVELMSMALEAAQIDFEFDVVDRIEVCREYLASRSYDAVLSDYRLQGFTAYQTLKLLREARQEIPLILVTGNLEDDAAVECIKAGMTDYVMKDRLFRLPMVLRRSLDEFSLRRQQQAISRRLQQQLKREALVNQIVRAMRETLQLDEVMQTTADMLHEALQVERCCLFTLEPQSGVYVRQVSQESRDRDVLHHRVVQCPIFEHYYEQMRAGQPVVIMDVNANHSEVLPRVAYSYAATNNIRAFAMFPLLHQGNLLGGIIVHQCDRPRMWTDDDCDLASAVADQCAIAVHQARLFEQVQRHAQHEQLLNHISQSINSSLDPTFILQEIVRLTGETFQVDRVIIYNTHADSIQTKCEWLADANVPSMATFTAPACHWFDAAVCPGEMPVDWVLHVPHYSTLPANSTRQEMITQYWLQSVLAVPIFMHDVFMGGLELHTVVAPRMFTPTEIQLLQQIANQAAIALCNAQSYAQLEALVQKRTKELVHEKYLSEAANRAKSEFLAHMSHELRTPLTGILGFTNILTDQLESVLNPEQQKYIEAIASCGQHLLDLINDLLDLSKIEAGREELFLEPVVVQEVCDACVGMVQETARQRNLPLHLDIEPDLTVCVADKRRLKQILSNLLSNAVKFTNEGYVRLSVCAVGRAIHFIVTDTGIGIAPADQEKLFQAFLQLDSGLSRRYEGTGLGLVLARKLAQLHGGDIVVQSELGKGSQFTLILPDTEQDLRS